MYIYILHIVYIHVGNMYLTWWAWPRTGHSPAWGCQSCWAMDELKAWTKRPGIVVLVL